MPMTARIQSAPEMAAYFFKQPILSESYYRSEGDDDVDDEQILDLYWKRSESAITETAKKFGRYCWTIAWNILSDAADAEECENDVYLAAWNTIPPKRPTHLAIFLGRLTRNIALDKYDYKTAQKRNQKFEQILSELEDCLVSPHSVETQYEAGQTAETINRFLREQPYESRAVFLRRYWYSDSIRDIAKQFGISESKVKSMLFRTRNRLRQYLEKEGIYR
jgi:RNA polymerase sigma factor, sigma-70 family